VMDMARTSINLVGNCLATAVMARWEGELEFEAAPARLAAAPVAAD
jgi:proton glutamate symport protein